MFHLANPNNQIYGRPKEIQKETGNFTLSTEQCDHAESCYGQRKRSRGLCLWRCQAKLGYSFEYRSHRRNIREPSDTAFAGSAPDGRFSF